VTGPEYHSDVRSHRSPIKASRPRGRSAKPGSPRDRLAAEETVRVVHAPRLDRYRDGPMRADPRAVARQQTGHPPEPSGEKDSPSPSAIGGPHRPPVAPGVEWSAPSAKGTPVARPVRKATGLPETARPPEEISGQAFERSPRNERARACTPLGSHARASERRRAAPATAKGVGFTTRELSASFVPTARGRAREGGDAADLEAPVDVQLRGVDTNRITGPACAGGGEEPGAGPGQRSTGISRATWR